MQPAELSRALLVLSETHGSEQFACLDHLIGSITRWMLLRVLMSAWIEVTRYKCAPKPHRHNIKTIKTLLTQMHKLFSKNSSVFSLQAKINQKDVNGLSNKKKWHSYRIQVYLGDLFLLFSPKLPTKGVVNSTPVTQPAEFSDWITWLLGLE